MGREIPAEGDGHVLPQAAFQQGVVVSFDRCQCRIFGDSLYKEEVQSATAFAPRFPHLERY